MESLFVAQLGLSMVKEGSKIYLGAKAYDLMKVGAFSFIIANNSARMRPKAQMSTARPSSYSRK
jgi:hypothetical protein